MERTTLEVNPQFSQPFRQIIMMLIVIGLASSGGVLAAPQILPVFFSNIYLNGFIVAVFAIGVLSCFTQVIQLMYSVRWIENFAANRTNATTRAPSLLAPLATLLSSRSAQMKIAASSNQSILESVATRIEEAREITRYIVNTLILLGLFGTFYGLATTVPALVETIRSLTPQEGESGIEVFGRLMDGLEGQLDGMGVAFASSLLGLAGSLLVSLLELFAGHGQNRFYRELEEWLSSITRLGFSSGEIDVGSEQDIVTAVFSQMAEQLQRIQDMFVQSDASRAQVDQKLSEMTSALNTLARHIEENTPSAKALERVANGQEQLSVVLGDMERSEAMDVESRMRLRSIDVQLLRLVEEISTGRHETTRILRGEIEALNRTITSATQQNDPK